MEFSGQGIDGDERYLLSYLSLFISCLGWRILASMLTRVGATLFVVSTPYMFPPLYGNDSSYLGFWQQPLLLRTGDSLRYPRIVTDKIPS